MSHATRTALVVFLAGIVFLLIFLLAPPARGKGRPDPIGLDIGDCTFWVTPHILEPFTGKLKDLAWSGSTYWAYLDSTMYRIDWWGIEIEPDDADADFVWSSGLDLILYTKADSILVTDFILAGGCIERHYDRCRRVDVMRGVVIDYKALVVPQRNPRIQGFVGTRRGALRPESLVGLTLEVK